MTGAQDPDEPFDLYDRDGRPLGRSKPRRLVHRDGDWHRSVHVWVLLTAGPGVEGAAPGPWVLFQRRSLEKDTWPGALDVAVAGHLRAGESVSDALREADEEIGLPLALADVVRLGLRRRVDDRVPGILDRELQEIFAAPVTRGLTGFRPDPSEVTALAALPLGEAAGMFRGECSAVEGLLWEPGADVGPFVVRVDDLILAPDGYWGRASASLLALVAGGCPEAPWEIG